MFLRSQVVPARLFGSEGPTLAFDVTLLSPDREVSYLARLGEPGWVDRLAGFLFAAAADFHPETSLPVLSVESLGLTVSVGASTEEKVEMDWTVVPDLGAEVRDYDTMRFETSRAVLAAAAQSIRCLDGSGLIHNGAGELG